MNYITVSAPAFPRMLDEPRRGLPFELRHYHVALLTRQSVAIADKLTSTASTADVSTSAFHQDRRRMYGGLYQLLVRVILQSPWDDRSSTFFPTATPSQGDLPHSTFLCCAGMMVLPLMQVHFVLPKK